MPNWITDYLNGRAMARYTAQETAKALREGTDAAAQNKATGSPEVQRCAMLYKQAVDADLSLRTDRAVWDCLTEQHDKADLPPSFKAFRQTVTRARKAGLLPMKRCGEKRIGKSVVRRKDI
ncbi:MAG: hypothetical protein WD042_03030 [Phycisphaeraceae bacterium]